MADQTKIKTIGKNILQLIIPTKRYNKTMWYNYLLKDTITAFGKFKIATLS